MAENELYTACKKYMNITEYRKAFDCIVNLWNESGMAWYKVIEAFRRSMKKMVTESNRSEECYELLHESYVLTGAERFDDFMIAAEWYRPPEEKFWVIRREQLLPVADALQEMVDGDLDELFLSMPPRVGKALANDTPILTRNGWKNHGDLVVGDEVIGMDGAFKKVIAVHPKCMLDVEVEFTNGEKVLCHENHEWKLFDRTRMKTILISTAECEKRQLSTGGEAGHRGHRYMLQLPLRDFVDGEEKELPLDPYTFGVWLGDGANRNPRMCGAESDRPIIDKIVANGHPIRWSVKHKTTGVMYYDFDIRRQLRSIRMCHSRQTLPKHIPEEYLTASVSQRLELLAGLLDTDGTLVRDEHRYQFTTADEPLRDSFVALVSTFGWRCNVTKREPTTSSSGITARRPHYIIGFNPTCYIPCVLERKQLREYSKPRKIAIKSITRVEPKEGNCITVEGDGMYLFGRTMLPTHNSTIIRFFIVWYMLKFPKKTNLYSSFTEKVVKAFYNGVLEILEDAETYDIRSMFPKANVAATDAKDLLIYLDKKRAYANLTSRAIMGTLNGACDADGIVIGDDLHSGIDEARSKDQLIKKWETVRANFLSRKKGDGKILWIGTRWSLMDCIANRLEMLENDPDCGIINYKVVNVPALNEDDESNFDYAFHKGFSTADFKVIRASYESKGDSALWLAPYMGQPIERDGAVFSPDDMRYYNGELPKDVEPDRKFLVVDPAWGGGDYVAAIAIYQYGDDMFIPAVVFNKGDKGVTQPLLVSLIKKHDLSAVYIESTRVTASYAEELDKRLREVGIRVNMQSSVKNWNGQQGKQQRIYDKAPEIRERYIFLDARYRDKEYGNFMQNVFSFVVEGKNKNDDAPDVLAMGLVHAFRSVPKVQVIPASRLDFF